MRVLITGANRGIGQSLFEGYQSRGADVTGTRRTPVTDEGPWRQLDVSDPQSVSDLSADWGDDPLDLLICNAGVYLDKGDRLADGYPPDAWAQTFAVNVTGVFLTVQAFLPNLRAANGKVAIISSQMGSSERANGGSYIYRASKAAALNLGLNLAADLEPSGIAVGIYHPGWVQTDMGGDSAAITPEASAAGLIDRFDTLSLATTGVFETWDGRPHPT